MIYVDLSYTGQQEGTKDKPLSHIPKWEDGLEYHLSGICDQYFNIDRSITIYGDMLFRSEAIKGKAIRVAADNVKILGGRIHTKNGAHGIQAIEGVDFEFSNLGITTEGKGFGISHLAGFPFKAENNRINNTFGAIQIQPQTEVEGADLEIINNRIDTTVDPESGDGIFIGSSVKGHVIDFQHRAFIQRNIIKNVGENAIDLVSAAHTDVSHNIMMDGNVAMLFGSSKGDLGHGHKVSYNKFYRFFGGAVGVRGGYDCEVFKNEIYDCPLGFYINAYGDFYDNQFIRTPVEYRIAPGFTARINGSLVRA